MLKAILPVDVQSFVEGSSLRTGIYLLEPIKPSSHLAEILGVEECEGPNGMNIGGLRVYSGDNEAGAWTYTDFQAFGGIPHFVHRVHGGPGPLRRRHVGVRREPVLPPPQAQHPSFIVTLFESA